VYLTLVEEHLCLSFIKVLCSERRRRLEAYAILGLLTIYGTDLREGPKSSEEKALEDKPWAFYAW
jgi:hypothetical protein